MVLKHRVMSHDWHAFSNQWFQGISSCLTTCVFQTNGFKASPRVSHLVFVFKPMVLSHHVESHNWHSMMLISMMLISMMLIWIMSISNPVVTRHQIRPPNHVHGTCLTTNGFKASDPSARYETFLIANGFKASDPSARYETFLNANGMRRFV